MRPNKSVPFKKQYTTFNAFVVISKSTISTTLSSLIKPQHRIRVKFEKDIDIEFNDIHHCTFDYVKILNGLSPLATKSNEITTLCGNVEEFDDEEEANKWLGPYDSKSNTMTIHFHSDDHYTERGFKGSLTVIKKDEL